MIGYTKKFAHYRDPQKDAYDLLLGDYEEGMDQKQYDEFFRGIRENLLPLIRDVRRSPWISMTSMPACTASGRCRSRKWS